MINTIHILPFYPYSSDDGFSVIDYKKVDPACGTWENIESLRKNFALMFDAVINHISAESSWFKDYLAGKKKEIWTTFSADQVDLNFASEKLLLPLISFVRNSPNSVG